MRRVTLSQFLVARQRDKVINADLRLLVETIARACKAISTRVNKGALASDPRLLGFATTVRDHELAHVDFLKQALGSAAGAKPAFDFKGTTEDPGTFAATALVLEDTGVAAYNGQGPRLRRKTLAAAASIVSVEARHAAWIRRIVAGPDYAEGKKSYPAPAALDKPQTKAQIEAAVGQTGFIQG